MKNKFFLVLFCLVILLTSGIAQNVYTLKNQKIEFSIDGKGNMLSLKNLETGFNYASGQPVWRLYFDTKNEKDIEILAGDNLPSVSKTGDKITFNYKGLKCRGENKNFDLSLTILLEDDMVRFGSEVKNNELHTVIRELQYPLVANIQVPPDHQLLTTDRGGQLIPDAKQWVLSAGYSYKAPDQLFRQRGIKYPSGPASNCFALIGRSQGLYFGSHDPSFQDTWHGLRVYPDGKGEFNELEVGLYKYPNCLSGESWENNSNVIAPYNGDWHQTSKIYREWANTWWEHREPPMWVKEMNGFQRIILKHQYGETLFKYSEFGNRVKAAGESAGINVAFPFGWWNSGMDNGYPDSYFVTDPEMGGDAAWKQAIADYKKGGGKVIMYYNGKLIDVESDYYKSGKGKEVCFKTNTGTEWNEAYRFSGPGSFTGYYDARSFVVADTKNPDWQKMMKKMADHAYELGANSIFYDQLGYGERTGNWDHSKEFPVPELCVIADKAYALKAMHDYIDKKYPEDYAIGTEHITDVTSQYVDYVHSVTTVRGSFLEWFRYTFPEIIVTDRNLDGDEPYIKRWVNQTVLLGLRSNLQTFRLRGLIDETPVLQHYLAKINQLKQKYSSLLLLGTFRDTEGFSVDNQDFYAKSFTNGNQMAIVMTQTYRDEALTHLSVPGYEYKESSGVGEFEVMFGSNGIPNITIGRDDIVVLIYEKE